MVAYGEVGKHAYTLYDKSTHCPEGEYIDMKIFHIDLTGSLCTLEATGFHS